MPTTRSTLMNDAKYIGLDVHQATISAAVLDSAGKLVMEAILETKAETMLQFLRGLRGSLHVTLEEGAGGRNSIISSSIHWPPCVRWPGANYWQKAANTPQ